MITFKNLKKVYKIPITKGFKRLFHQEYKEINAINCISGEIKKGELIGILGANGAGKSTLIKMLCGILTPSSGDLVVNEHIPIQRKKKYLKEIGVMMGNRSSLKYDLPVKDSFRYLKIIYEIDDLEYEKNLNKLISKIGLTDLLDTPVRKLSLGQRMKAEVVASIIHNPKVLFLDEPTLGLDIKSKNEMLEFIKFLNEQYNTTILLTTHDLKDVEKLCKRIIYINKGIIVYDGETNNFGVNKTKRRIHVILNDSLENTSILNEYKFTMINELEYEFMVEKENVMKFLKKMENESIDELNIFKISLEEAVLNYEKNNI